MYLIMFFLVDLLRIYVDEDFYVFIICLLLVKDGFIFWKNIFDLINLLNNIWVLLLFDFVVGSFESLNFE